VKEMLEEELTIESQLFRWFNSSEKLDCWFRNLEMKTNNYLNNHQKQHQEVLIAIVVDFSAV